MPKKRHFKKNLDPLIINSPEIIVVGGRENARFHFFHREQVLRKK